MRKRNFYFGLIGGILFYLYFVRPWITSNNSDNGGDGGEESLFYGDGDMCGFEPFVYKHVNSNNSVISGKKFDCLNGMKYLEMYNLTLKHRVLPKKAHQNNVGFVMAADTGYYPSARAVIHGIRKHFGNASKIVFYDLENAMKIESNQKEMMGICNFEARKFDWHLLPDDVKDLKIFAWKIMIIAEVFNEFDTFFYLDSSIFFETGDFDAYFDMINNGSITPFQMSGATGHGIRHATNAGTYRYLPMDDRILKEHDMLEANMMIFHKSEETRRIIKWAVLCALTRDCIEPPGAVLNCPAETKFTPEGMCHRQDQSVFNILLANLEQSWIDQKYPIITHVNPLHPKNSRQRHQTRRNQLTNGRIDTCANE